MHTEILKDYSYLNRNFADGADEHKSLHRISWKWSSGLPVLHQIPLVATCRGSRALAYVCKCEKPANIDSYSLNSSGRRGSSPLWGSTQNYERISVLLHPNSTNLEPSSKIAREQRIIGFADNTFSCCDLFRNVWWVSSRRAQSLGAGIQRGPREWKLPASPMNHRFENSPLWESCDYLEGKKKKKTQQILQARVYHSYN